MLDAALLVAPFEHYNKPVVDELNCLVINVTVPGSSDSYVKPYPVMVFIYSGSFLCGGPNVPAYNPRSFVSYSASRNIPVVAVSFNYCVRLGY